MKKKLIFCLTLFISSIAINAQTETVRPKVMVLKEVYEMMKQEGKLKPDVDYVFLNPTSTATNSPVIPATKENIPPINRMGGGVSNTYCSCYVPLDASFNIAEFAIGDPPEYRNDDGSTAAKTLPFNFCLYGTQYNQLYINTNGNVSFGSPYATYSSTGFPSNQYVMVAPFWADVDIREGTNIPTSGLVYYKITPTYMIVKWESVGYYNSNGIDEGAHTDKLNTFQLIITDGTDPIIPQGNNIAFCYGDMQWTAGDASQGVNGFGGVPSTVGANKGNGTNYFQIGRFNQAGSIYNGPTVSSGVSWLDYKSFFFNSCASTNIAPIAQGFNNCDTLRICGTNDTLIIDGIFLAPEANQITNIAINLNGTANATVLAQTSGVNATGTVMIIANAANAGNNVITFTATDNGTPVGTTIINVNIFVDTTGLANFNPQIVGNLAICPGTSTTLSVSPTNYNSYLWNTGSTNTAITVNTPGPYYVTSKKNNCNKTNLVNVIQYPASTPQILGPPFVCSGGTSTTTTLYLNNSSLYNSYSWNNGSTNDSITVGAGNYTITAINTFGCSGSAAINVQTFNPTVSISGNQLFCPGESIVLNANPTIPQGANYLWSTTATTQSITVNTAGTYSVNIAYNNGCIATNNVVVNINSAPIANFNENPPGTSGPNILVTFADNSSSSGTITNYIWNFGDSTNVFYNGQTVGHTYASDGVYTVTLAVQSNNGCWDTIRKEYTIISQISAPNVFTPNDGGASGVNQFLYFKNLSYFKGSAIVVYNRWGNKIYESSDYGNDWNGGSHPSGVYYYVLTNSKFDVPKTGFVHLIR